jgi:hypothetical protein
MKIGFVFIGYDQFTELEFTTNIIKNQWSKFADSTIISVLSGDPGGEFDDTNVDQHITVPNIVTISLDYLREHFIPATFDISPGIGAGHYAEPAASKAMESMCQSMLRNYRVGLESLFQISNDVDAIVICESNILLLSEDGLYGALEEMLQTQSVIACQVVGGYADPVVKWTGREIMPQIFMLDADFVRRTQYLLKSVNTRPDCPEMTLLDNLLIALKNDEKSFEKDVLNKGTRSQWGIHQTWFPFAHLDRPPGADHNGGQRWGSREQQIEMEKNVLARFGLRV